MSVSSNKTVAHSGSVENFIDSLSDAQQIKDSRALLRIFNKVTGKQPTMWGTSMIGYGEIKLTYKSGREIEWFTVGFSPRKGKVSLYVTLDAAALTRQFPQLGTYKTGKGCIYIRRLADVNLIELERLISLAYQANWQDPERADGKEQTVRAEVVE